MFIFVGWSKAIHANHLLYLYYTIFQQLSQEIITFSHPNHAEGVYIINAKHCISSATCCGFLVKYSAMPNVK